MIDIFGLKDTVVKVLFWFNIIFLAIAIVITSKAYTIFVIFVNVIFTGTFIVIDKWSHMFENLPLNKQLNGILGSLLGGEK